jgi:uncharacterized membrane protein YraQ (UPF0718 family)
MHMNLGEDLEVAVGAVSTTFNWPVLLVKIGIGLVLAAAGGWVIWKLFFAEHQAAVKHDQVQATGQTLVNKAQGDAGAGAVGIVAGNAKAETKTHEITRDHYYEITKQPGAGDPVSQPVWDAFVRSVCMRPSAISLPECDRLQKTDP